MAANISKAIKRAARRYSKENKATPNDRFFVQTKWGWDNPQEGLIVDSDAVKDNFDFFMVSQAVKKTDGTANPTNYNGFQITKLNSHP